MSSINADNGVVSGITGVRVTADSTGNLALQSNGVTVLTLATNNTATFSSNVTTAGLTIGTTALGAGNATRFKNRIINGDMVIDQRNAGANVSTTTTATPTYTLDRWAYQASQASKFTVQQNAGAVTPPVGFSNYLGVTSTSAYAITSSDYFLMRQPIEGFNTADLMWGTANAKTVTLSFQVYSSLTGTFGGALANSGNTRSYPFSYSIPTANTWTQISITIAGDTSGTWIGATNGLGILVVFGLGVGSTYSNTAGAWAAGNYLSATSATSVVAVNGATWYVTGTQLEVGSSATGFEYVDYTTQLSMCYRYARKTNGAVNTEPTLYSFGNNSQVIGQSWVYPVPMRTSPTVTTTGTLSIGNASGPTIAADLNSYLLYVSPSSGTAGSISYQPNGSYQILFSAEL